MLSKINKNVFFDISYELCIRKFISKSGELGHSKRLLLSPTKVEYLSFLMIIVVNLKMLYEIYIFLFYKNFLNIKCN